MRKKIIAAVVTLIASSAAVADTFVVDTEVDAMLTGCSGLVIGDCSLRGAIERSNQAPGLDTITFGFGANTFVLSITGADEDSNQSGDLDILDPVDIDGGGDVTVDGSLIGDRVFDVLTDTTSFTGFKRVVITGGHAPAGDGFFAGGGIRCLDGAVFLDHTTVIGNGPVREGGGVWADGCDLVLNFSVVSNNTATVGGGGASLTSSTLHAPVSAFVGNHSDSFGGGLKAGFFTEVDLDNMTLSGNTAGVSGSAILYQDDVTLDFVTVVSDPSSGISAIAQLSGLDPSLTMSNTLLVGSCSGSGLFTSGGGNLESPGDTCGLDPLVDQVNVADARLLPLTVSGSATPYHLPMADSPAVDDPLGTITKCPSHDQRFAAMLRPFDGNGDGIAACDIGAIERDALFTDGFETGDTSRWPSEVALP